MIAALFTAIAAAPRMRAALRYGAIVLAGLLFRLALRRPFNTNVLNVPAGRTGQT